MGNIRLLIVGVFFLLAWPAQAERVNWKFYDRCQVWQYVDDLTDETQYDLECSDRRPDSSVTFRYVPQHGTLVVMLGRGRMIHREKQIPIAIRIDKGIVRREIWSWSQEHQAAYTTNQSLVRRLMNELSPAKRMVIEIGENRGSIRLDGSAAAIRDFRQRINIPISSGVMDYSDEAMRYVFEPCWRIVLRASFGQTADNEDEALAVMREKEQEYVTQVMSLLVPLVSGQPWKYRERIYQSNLQACLDGVQRGVEKTQ